MLEKYALQIVIFLIFSNIIFILLIVQKVVVIVKLSRDRKRLLREIVNGENSDHHTRSSRVGK
ncbi:MAG: hypothetical protein ACI86H_000083 [bacterium]|jgi:hypothetical protein